MDVARNASPISRTGPFSRLQRAVGLMDADNPRTARRAVVFAVVSWLPLVILAGVQGLSANDTPERSVLMDFSTHARFLLAAPLLSVGEVVAKKKFSMIADYFIASGIVAGPERGAYSGIIFDSQRLRDSWVVELFLLLSAYASSAIALYYTVNFQPPTWLVAGAPGSRALSWAGLWYVAAPLPLFHFLVFSSLWTWFIWLIHLWRLSRLRLRLTPTHPDRAGGLNILSDSSYAIAIFVFAIGSVVASVWAEDIVFNGASVGGFNRLFIAYLLLAILFSFGPLLIFMPGLNRLRLSGLLDYGALASRHAQLFDEKWIRNAGTVDESILGSPDISSLADMDDNYDAVNKMRLFPSSLRSVAIIVAAALIPMAPLILMEFPLSEVLKTLVGVVF